MHSVTILSPHQDDAALSLALTICAAERRGGSVRIINCFTVSTYAPHSAARGAEEVGAVRAAEDREFVARIAGSIEIVDLGMKDAPVRLSCGLAEVRRRAVGRAEITEADRLATTMQRLAEGFVLAPLGLGRHIDHLIAREAGIRLALLGRSVLFYEDLPYAAELRECCILRGADVVARRLGSRMAGAIVHDEEAAGKKRFAIEAYRSQLARAQLDSVIRYGARIGGERIWAPRTLAAALPALECAGVEAGGAAPAWRRRFQCAAHAAANRARVIFHRAAEGTMRGGVDAPQTT